MAEEQTNTASPRVELDRAAGAWVLLGFLGFGSVVGFLAGASNTAGVGQSLMTGLMAFVGGGLLSLVAFVFKSDETPQIRAKASGQALFGLAIGVWIGLGIGIKARLAFEASEDARVLTLMKSSVAVPTAASKPSEAASAPSAAPPSSVAAVDPKPAPTPAPKPTSKPTTSILLHADPAMCSTITRLISARDLAGYYRELPEAKDADLQAKREACGSP